MLALRRLTKSYHRIIALDGLDFSLKKGEIYALLGPNGAGKSTTLKILAGLISADSGEIRYLGSPVNPRDDLKYKGKIAYVPDEPFLYSKLTGEEHLHLYGDLYHLSGPVRKKKIDFFFDYFEFSAYRHRLTESFSAGTKQKLLLAQALMVDPEILLLDEPLMSIDPLVSRQCKRYLKEVASRGTIILFATHILPLALEVSRRIGIIFKGKILHEIQPDELANIKDPRDLESRYTGIITRHDHPA